MRLWSIWEECKKVYILLIDDHIWIKAEIEVGNNLIGYCKILKMMMVIKALAAVI